MLTPSDNKKNIYIAIKRKKNNLPFPKINFQVKQFREKWW